MKIRVLRFAVITLFIAIFALGFNFLKFFSPDSISNSSYYINHSSGPVLYSRVPVKVFPSRRELITDSWENNKLTAGDFSIEDNGYHYYSNFLNQSHPSLTRLAAKWLKSNFNTNCSGFSSSVLAKYCILLI